jgi:hypothetical protein
MIPIGGNRMIDENKLIEKFEAIARVETKLIETEKNIQLARDLVEKETQNAKETIEHRLVILNENQRRMDRLESLFSTKEYVDSLIKYTKESRDKDIQSLKNSVEKDLDNFKNLINPDISSLKKIVYIGLGIVLTIQFILMLLIRVGLLIGK